MKVLCLHGSYGSAANFKVQLGPFVNAIEKPGSVDFRWIDGGFAATPPLGFDSYFGKAPLYRFINSDGISGFDDVLVKIRDLPAGLTAEDTMRRLTGDETFRGANVKSALDRLFDILDEDPEIDGIMGYSEGATTAATLILEERRRLEEEGRPRRIKVSYLCIFGIQNMLTSSKYGIFFAGWPPLRLQGDAVQCLLADECEDVIDIPTCHVVGCRDPYIHGAMALFSMCDEDTATLFDHGKGHTVPRDVRTVNELAAAIQGTLNGIEIRT